MLNEQFERSYLIHLEFERITESVLIVAKIDFLPFVEKMKHRLVYPSDVYSSPSGCPSVRFNIGLFINHRRENFHQRADLRISSLLRLGEQFPVELQLDEKQSTLGSNEAHRSRLLVCAKHLFVRSLFFHLGILL